MNDHEYPSDEELTKINGLLQNRIADDVWPDGWSGNCHICGKPFNYTNKQCAYYLAHGWPKCDHSYDPPQEGRENKYYLPILEKWKKISYTNHK